LVFDDEVGVAEFVEGVCFLVEVEDFGEGCFVDEGTEALNVDDLLCLRGLKSAGEGFFVSENRK
jgi:hypothetical protein